MLHQCSQDACEEAGVLRYSLLLMKRLNEIESAIFTPKFHSLLHPMGYNSEVHALYMCIQLYCKRSKVPNADRIDISIIC